MEEDLGLSPGTLGTMPFPQDMYTTLYGLPTGTLPGTSGTYPHAYTKGEYTADAIPAIDASKDGECSKRDSMAQVIAPDCSRLRQIAPDFPKRNSMAQVIAPDCH